MTVTVSSRPSTRLIVATLDLVAPREPGVYLVEADMVREGERWFADDGSAPVRIELWVEAARRPA